MTVQALKCYQTYGLFIKRSISYPILKKLKYNLKFFDERKSGL